MTEQKLMRYKHYTPNLLLEKYQTFSRWLKKAINCYFVKETGYLHKCVQRVHMRDVNLIGLANFVYVIIKNEFDCWTPTTCIKVLLNRGIGQ